MKDLVERLRAEAKGINDFAASYAEARYADLMTEAAAEIERLQQGGEQ